MAGETKDIKGGKYPAYFYDQMMAPLRKHLPRLICIIASMAWVWFFLPDLGTWPTFWGQAPILWLTEIALAAWALFTLFLMSPALFYRSRWLKQEAGGQQMVRLNDRDFQLTFYRASDGSKLHDTRTREERFAEEVSAMHTRNEAAIRAGMLTLPLLAFAVAFPFVMTFIRENTLGLGSLELFFYPGFTSLVSLAVLWRWLATPLTQFLLTFVDMSAYAADRLFIHGARPQDPVVPPVTLETLRALKTKGHSEITDPAEGASALRSSKK